MTLHNIVLLFLLLIILFSSATYAQGSSLYSKLNNLPDKLFNRIDAKSKYIKRKLTKQTENYLARLVKQEKKLKKKLWKKDSVVWGSSNDHC